MEDAAGVVRRIILLWCEVIIPPCPPSLSSSLVYFWLAAVCMCKCVCAVALSFLHTLCKFTWEETWEKNIRHLCVVCWLEGHGTCVYVCGCVCVRVWLHVWICGCVANSSTLSLKSSPPHLHQQQQRQKHSRRPRPELNAEQRSS